VWSGLAGGLFVQLAYFGTDQSQVQRYLGGGSLAESRLGLLLNGLVKVPMQLGILFVGLMVFVFYQFHAPPLLFHRATLERLRATPAVVELERLEAEHAAAFADERRGLDALVAADAASDGAAASGARARLREGRARVEEVRGRARALVARALPGTETKDADYVFIGFVLDQLPSGLIGLLLAVILCAAMSATAAALNALGTTTVVDFYRRSLRPSESDAHYLAVARWLTVGWGALAVAFASFASLFENLIQAVNILGSLFYGPMLGVFLVGFFTRRVRGNAVFFAALVAQAAVLATFAWSRVSFLWYNVIGCAVVVALAPLVEPLLGGRRAEA
jgi:uncharacterized sodium:solute symporter family permease YidK